MNDFDYDYPVTSPTLDADAGIVHSPKAFSDVLTLELTDDEIQQAATITLEVKRKYERIFRAKLGPHVSFTVEQAMKLIDQFEDEIKTRLAERLDLLVTVDAAPVFEGKPPVVEFVGALPSHSSAQYGQDHEKKAWEVKKAQELGQPFLGADKLE